MSHPKLVFWFEFASTYSYLSVMRLPELAQAAGVDVSWRPFLLGPIFKSQGWDTSPFVIYPAKGNYMLRDVERQTEKQGLRFCPPVGFPQNGLLAARVAHLALDTPKGITFCQNVYLMQFEEGQNISEPEVITACLIAAGLPADLIDQAQDVSNKHRLRESTEAAIRHGIFGAPSFTIGEELFWGDDRLEDALAWAAKS